MALNAATALTAALTLFFSRLDSRRQHSTEKFDFRAEMWNLSWAVHNWLNHAWTTNNLMQLWAQGNLNNAEAAEALRDPFKFQIAAPDEVLALLRGENHHDKPDDRSEWRSLRHLLNLYGPEVLETLETGLRGRRELIDELIAELPQLGAGGPELLQATVGRLESTYDELDRASDQLGKYIRDHFPPDDTWMQ